MYADTGKQISDVSYVSMSVLHGRPEKLAAIAEEIHVIYINKGELLGV